MILQITPEAINQAYSPGRKNPLTECLLATAAKLQFPDRFVECGADKIKIGLVDYRIPKDGILLVENWCGREHDTPLRPLPCSVTLEKL